VYSQFKLAENKILEIIRNRFENKL